MSEFAPVDERRLRQALELFFLGALAFAHQCLEFRIAGAQGKVNRGKNGNGNRNKCPDCRGLDHD
ncbi:MAG: hypothetical protein MUE79_08625 [Nitratireductor sp.]|nr:hypothetical protein [Nitratireductor sp.]